MLLDSKAVRLALFQPLEHIVHCVHKLVIVLFDLHAGDHVHQRVHVPVLLRSLEDDIGDEGTVQKRLGLLPKGIALLALALGVGDQGVHEFQDVGLVADIRQRVVVHGLGKIYAVEHLDFVPTLLQERADLSQHTALRVLSIRIEKKVNYFYEVTTSD